MAKKCFYCGTKLGMFSTKMMTRDGLYLCKDDTDKLFDVAKMPKKAQGFWIRQHRSSEIKELLDSGQQVDGLQVQSDYNLYTIEQAKQTKERIEQFKAQQAEAKRPKCPHCGSHNITPLGQHKKAFSVGKAVGGAILTGGIGAVAGFAGKKTKKVDYVCNNCGKTFVR